MNPRTDRTPPGLSRLPVALALLAGLAAAAGCSKPVAVVTGTVTFDNKPLTTGEIHFLGPEGKSRSTVIGTDGTYRVDNAPVGKVKVAVVARKVEGEGKLMANPWKALPKPATVTSLIPTKYNDPEQSGLSYDVAMGQQTIDVALKKK